MDATILIGHYLAMTFRSAFQYRGNIIAGVTGLALSSVFQLLGAIVVVQKFGTADGWDLGQIAFMFGLWRVQYGVMLLLLAPVWNMAWLVREGMVDRFLVRPRSPLVQIPGVRFNVVGGIGQIMAGIGMAAFGAVYSPFEWTVWSAPWLGVIMVSGTAIQMSLMLIMGSFGLYNVRIGNTIGTIDRAMWQINLFPISVYSTAVQALLTFVVPWAFMVFYPAHALYRRGGDVFLGSSVTYLAPVAAAASALVAGLVWRRAVRSYQGMGGM